MRLYTSSHVQPRWATRLDQGLHQHLARHRAVVHDQHVHVGEDDLLTDISTRLRRLWLRRAGSRSRAEEVGATVQQATFRPLRVEVKRLATSSHINSSTHQLTHFSRIDFPPVMVSAG